MMDSNSAAPQPNISAGPISDQPNKLTEKVTEATGEFVSNNYEGFLHKLVNFIFMILNFLKNTLLNIINQVLSKD